MQRSFIAICLLFASIGAQAYTSYSGYVSNVSPDWFGNGYLFTLAGTKNGCTSPTVYAIPSTSLSYHDAVATILMAYASGKTLIVTVNTTPCNPSMGGGVGNAIGVTVP